MKMLASICGAALCTIGVGIMASTDPQVSCQEIQEVLLEAVEDNQLTRTQADAIVNRCFQQYS